MIGPELKAGWPALEGASDAFVEALAEQLKPAPRAPGSNAVISAGEVAAGLWFVDVGPIYLWAEIENATVVIDELQRGAVLGAAGAGDARRFPCNVVVPADAAMVWLSPDATERLRAEWAEEVGTLCSAAEKSMQRIALLIAFQFNVVYGDLPLHVRESLIDVADLIVLHSGETLFREGEESDALYLTLSGRLRIQRVARGQVTRLRDIGPGESVGEMGPLMSEPRAADVIATRDTQLVKLPSSSYLSVLQKHPEPILRAAIRATQSHFGPDARERRRFAGRLPAMAIIPADPSIDIPFMSRALADAFKLRGGTVKVISSQDCIEAGYASEVSGKTAGSPVGTGLLEWLTDLERRYSCLIYAATDPNDPWTDICLRQTDRVIVVAHADGDAGSKRISALLAPYTSTRDIGVALVHRTEVGRATNSGRWLDRLSTKTLYHVREGNRVDWQRVARFLTGNAVGVVLGGGGARGFAHVGILRALDEMGVPVDVIGGTSVGALIAGQYALGLDRDVIFDNVMDLVRQGEQFTLPIVSFTSGRRFSTGLHRIFGDVLIRDLRHNFFCVSCNLTKALATVHTEGLLWRAVLASNSPPGLFPPMVEGGDLYVDGGLLNGLPIDVMMGLNENGLLIVCDVHPNEDLKAGADYDEGLSGWKVFWSRISPFSESIQMPGMLDILYRSMAIGSLAQREKVLRRRTDILLRPPTGMFSMADHRKGQAIADIGYRYAVEEVGPWWERQVKLAAPEAGRSS